MVSVVSAPVTVTLVRLGSSLDEHTDEITLRDLDLIRFVIRPIYGHVPFVLALERCAIKRHARRDQPPAAGPAAIGQGAGLEQESGALAAAALGGLGQGVAGAELHAATKPCTSSVVSCRVVAAEILEQWWT